MGKTTIFAPLDWVKRKISDINNNLANNSNAITELNRNIDVLNSKSHYIVAYDDFSIIPNVSTGINYYDITSNIQIPDGYKTGTILGLLAFNTTMQITSIHFDYRNTIRIVCNSSKADTNVTVKAVIAWVK